MFEIRTKSASFWHMLKKFKGASGKLNVIGEADFNAGHIGLRYDGEVCFEKKEEARGNSSSAASALSLRNIWLPIKFARRESTAKSTRPKLAPCICRQTVSSSGVTDSKFRSKTPSPPFMTVKGRIPEG
jgi:hypothetical protein